MLFCLMSSLENCLISTYLLWFSTRVQMEKNWGDTPSATLKVKTLLLTLCIIGHLYGHHLKVLQVCIIMLSLGLIDVPRWKKDYVGFNLLTCVDSEFK